MNDQPECTCATAIFEDPPCPEHGPPTCEACGHDEHPFISCVTSANIRKRSTSAQSTSGDKENQ